MVDCVTCNGQKGFMKNCVPCIGTGYVLPKQEQFWKNQRCPSCDGQKTENHRIVGNGKKWNTCTSCSGTGKMNPVILALEKKTKQMRDDHKLKLDEIQEVQKIQLDVIKHNELKLQEMVDNHQLSISKLNDQNAQLLQNQELMMKFVVDASRKYKEMMAYMCEKIKSKGLIEDDMLETNIKLLDDEMVLKYE